jgi:hypothetical protein
MKYLCKLKNPAILSAALSLGFPLFASADVSNITDVYNQANTVLGDLVTVIFGVALIYFLWNLTQFILNMDNEDARKKARDHMVWGIVALFVMVSVWGLVGVLGGTFKFSATSATIPVYPGK